MLLTLRRTSPGDIDSFKPRFAFPHERLEQYSACHQHLASTQTMRLPSRWRVLTHHAYQARAFSSPCVAPSTMGACLGDDPGKHDGLAGCALNALQQRRQQSIGVGSARLLSLALERPTPCR